MNCLTAGAVLVFIAAAPQGQPPRPVERIEDIVRGLPSGKGEFETTDAYEARVARHTKRVHRIQDELYDATYNADTETYTLEFPGTIVASVHVATKGTYKARTRMNVPFTVERRNVTAYVLDVLEGEGLLASIEIHVPRAKAARLKNTFVATYDFRVVPGLDGNPTETDVEQYETSLDEPYDGTRTTHRVYVALESVRITSTASGREIYRLDARTLAAEEEKAQREEQEQLARQRSEDEARAQALRAEGTGSWPAPQVRASSSTSALPPPRTRTNVQAASRGRRHSGRHASRGQPRRPCPPPLSEPAIAFSSVTRGSATLAM
jgi:hypothetical protein